MAHWPEGFSIARADQLLGAPTRCLRGVIRAPHVTDVGLCERPVQQCTF